MEDSEIFEVMDTIQTTLMRCDDLRKKEYRGRSNPLAGHCYIACEALYHMLPEANLKPCTVKHEGVTHWFLKSRDTGTVYDPTKGQFARPVSHADGVGRGFLTKQPSKRAQELIKRTKDYPAKRYDARNSIHQLSSYASIMSLKTEAGELSYGHIERCCRQLKKVLDLHRDIGFQFEYDVIECEPSQ
tara:strand:+ start:606 stop:1166 length:561 start_codon:yes stop_codon:yes gene_type:complete